MTKTALNKYALAISSILLGAVFAQQALAQPTYVPNQRRVEVPAAMIGAGGRGGSGGGEESAVGSRDGVAYNTNSRYASHVRSSAPPPMDPTRVINRVDCTRPFDPFRGNLFCI